MNSAIIQNGQIKIQVKIQTDFDNKIHQNKMWVIIISLYKLHIECGIYLILKYITIVRPINPLI